MTEKRKKEMGDKGLKRRAKATRCCSKVPLLIEREKRRRRRDNGEKRKMKTRSNEMVLKEVIHERKRERERQRARVEWRMEKKR